VLSGRGLCDELITRPEESYRLCCVVVCDLETSRIGAPYIYIYDISSLRINRMTFVIEEQFFCEGRNTFLNIICPLEIPVVYSPPGSTLKNSEFFAHWICMRFVWISEQARVIFLYIMHWSVFTTETERVYCAIRAESLNKSRGQC